MIWPKYLKTCYDCKHDAPCVSPLYKAAATPVIEYASDRKGLSVDRHILQLSYLHLPTSSPRRPIYYYPIVATFCIGVDGRRRSYSNSSI